MCARRLLQLGVAALRRLQHRVLLVPRLGKSGARAWEEDGKGGRAGGGVRVHLSISRPLRRCSRSAGRLSFTSRCWPSSPCSSCSLRPWTACLSARESSCFASAPVSSRGLLSPGCPRSIRPPTRPHQRAVGPRISGAWLASYRLLLVTFSYTQAIPAGPEPSRLEVGGGTRGVPGAVMRRRRPARQMGGDTAATASKSTFCRSSRTCPRTPTMARRSRCSPTRARSAPPSRTKCNARRTASGAGIWLSRTVRTGGCR